MAVEILFKGAESPLQVNNERVNTKALRVGDKIKIGNCILTVEGGMPWNFTIIDC